MDPAAALKNILTYLEDVGHLEDEKTINLCKEAAAEACSNLAAWLRNGGFTPDAYEVAKAFVAMVDEAAEISNPT